MLPTIFGHLADERPDLETVWRQFANWAETHPDVQIIDPRRVARYIKGATIEDIADAFSVLVREGYLRQVFKVETPTGGLRGPEYDSPLEVPQQVIGEFGQRYDLDDVEIVPVFREVASDARERSRR